MRLAVTENKHWHARMCLALEDPSALESGLQNNGSVELAAIEAAVFRYVSPAVVRSKRNSEH